MNSSIGPPWPRQSQAIGMPSWERKVREDREQSVWLFIDYYLDSGKIDGVAKTPQLLCRSLRLPALHSSSLRRTYCTPHSSEFARLAFGAFCLAITF
jgi:hypothetical protein